MSATHGRCVGCHRRTGSGLALMGSEQFMSSALVMLGVDEARADSLLWRLLPQLQGPTLQVRACRRCGSGFRLGRFSSGKLPLTRQATAEMA